MRRAKIVATLGPATSSYETIRAIIDAGVDVARMNLSHGSYDVHEGIYRTVRKAADDAGRAVAILVDLQGPKIRLGKFEGGPYPLAEGDVFTITTEDVLGTKELSGTTFKGLPDDVNPGDMLLIDDGKVAVRVTAVEGPRVVTECVVPGNISNNKGINLPGVAVNVPALSQKDEDDLRWAIRLGADIIALSFVRNASDITRVHEIMAEEGARLPSSPKSRSRRRSTTYRRSSTSSTASWSPAATSVLSSPWRRCRSCRSTRSSWPAAGRSRSLSRHRCSSR